MKKHQPEFTYMRGLAIVLIVLGHSIYNSNQGFPALLENLLRGGTALFVFISGYFYHRVFHPRLVYREFMMGKVHNVLYPFLWVSLLGLLALALQWSLMYHRPLTEVAKGIYYTVRNGYVLYPHWYIPFIMAVFALSPLYSAYIRLSALWRWLLLLVFSLIAIWMHRPIGNINVVQSVIYFTPFYLLGIQYSAHEQSLVRLKVPMVMLALLGLVFTLVFQTYFTDHLGNFHKLAWQYKGIDWQFIQKFCLCWLVLGLCQWLAARELPQKLHNGLESLAEMSFAIFFIHPLFSLLFGVITGLARYKLPPGNPWTTVAFSALIFAFLMLGSVWSARWIKRRLGDRSRRFIGW
ncbi:acyltransferase family protein [Shewanella sedimentimangrovi]|uniref:Acyltransferase n=1 Tax=Shewanella sedimentimangrovi TaxID=2814293 RepID=A0ABX7QZN4_9GAMM|nr:acyltransferase [Shewanella sedimentimangrovi]QSX37007.1 acyltransferase [Shewanella sedimentimangrovi]